MLKIGVLISGNGSNLQAIINAVESGMIKAQITCVVSDKSNAFGLTRARNHNIPAFHIDPKLFPSREDYEKALHIKLIEYGVELVVLAGFMRILSPYFINLYPFRIINIHPSLLPSFPGAHAIRDAFNSGVEQTGVTVHFVDEGVDSGPIIEQIPVDIEKGDTLEQLETKIHHQEHILYPKVLQLFTENRIQIDGRRVTILKD